MTVYQSIARQRLKKQDCHLNVQIIHAKNYLLLKISKEFFLKKIIKSKWHIYLTRQLITKKICLGVLVPIVSMLLSLKKEKMIQILNVQSAKSIFVSIVELLFIKAKPAKSIKLVINLIRMMKSS